MKPASAARLQKVISRGIQPSRVHIVGIVGVVVADRHVCVYDDGGW